MIERNLALIILYRDVFVYLQHRDAGAPVHPNTIGLFGGAIECGETPRQAIIRECREETGYRLTAPYLLNKAFYQHWKYQGTRHVFLEKYDGFSKVSCYEGAKGEWLSWREIAAHPKILDQNKIILRQFYRRAQYYRGVSNSSLKF